MTIRSATRRFFRLKPEATPADFRLVWPMVLLLAAMANPAIGAPRPLESLRLVVSIQWLSEDETTVETPVVKRAAVPAAPASQISPFGAPSARARSTALPSSRFQRPPPHSTLRS